MGSFGKGGTSAEGWAASVHLLEDSQGLWKIGEGGDNEGTFLTSLIQFLKKTFSTTQLCKVGEGCIAQGGIGVEKGLGRAWQGQGVFWRLTWSGMLATNAPAHRVFVVH